MLKMKVETPDWDRKLRLLAETPDLIRKSVVGALSDTVDDVHLRQSMEMKRVFNNPTPYVMRGLKKNYPSGREGTQNTKARFGMGVMQAGTFFEFFPIGKSPEDIIRPHVFGGPRKMKRSERRLQQIGGLPAGTWTVMGADYPKNASGDISGARYTQMMHQLGALSDVARAQMGKSRQKNRSGTSYYIARKSGRPVAIIERNGKSTRVMLALTRQPQYKKRYDHFGVGRKQAEVSLPRHFLRIVNRYIDRMQ